MNRQQKWSDQVLGLPCPIEACHGVLIMEFALRADSSGLIQVRPIGIGPIDGGHSSSVDHAGIRLEVLDHPVLVP